MRCWLLALAVWPYDFAKACTTFAVGRGASATGSVLIGHSDDGDPSADARLVYVPAAEHPRYAARHVYSTQGNFPRSVSHFRGPGYEPNDLTDAVLGKGEILYAIGRIPEVPKTFAYQDTDYGAINEHNVALAESTCSAMFRTCQIDTAIGCEPGRAKGVAMMDIGTLSQLAMERATTAREAVQLMGDMAYKYGFFGSQDDNGYGEALQVADATEVWTFNILADDTGASAIWAAVRVPDDQVTVLANMFTIREVDVNDTANCLASPSVYSVAQRHGWWQPGAPLDFTEVYSNGEYGNKFYSGRRMWRGLTLAAPSSHLSPDYDDLKYSRQWPWSVKPDNPVSLKDLFGWYRDWYSGTPFDATKGLAAGYGRTPDRFELTGNAPGAWERTIALYRTNFLVVSELREARVDLPKEAAGVVWFAPGPAHYSPFLPIPSGLSTSLEPLARVAPWKYMKDSMNWACRKVMMVSQTRFDHAHPLVERRQQELEAAGEVLLAEAAASFAKDGDQKAFNDKFAEHARHALEAWHDLSDEIIFKFSDNARIPDRPKEDFPALGYPKEWLVGVGLDNGPPPVPPIREGRCPNWDDGCEEGLDLAAAAPSAVPQWAAVLGLAAVVAAAVGGAVCRRWPAVPPARERLLM